MNQYSKNTARSSQTGLFGRANAQKILILILNNWYVYLLAIVVCFGGGYMYMKYKIPTYYVSTTILVEEEESNPAEDLHQGFTVRPGSRISTIRY